MAKRQHPNANAVAHSATHLSELKFVFDSWDQRTLLSAQWSSLCFYPMDDINMSTIWVIVMSSIWNIIVVIVGGRGIATNWKVLKSNNLFIIKAESTNDNIFLLEPLSTCFLLTEERWQVPLVCWDACGECMRFGTFVGVESWGGVPSAVWHQYWVKFAVFK